MKAPTNRKLKAAREAVLGAQRLYECRLKDEGRQGAALAQAQDQSYEAHKHLSNTLRALDGEIRADERKLLAARQPYQKAPQKAKG